MAQVDYKSDTKSITSQIPQEEEPLFDSSIFRLYIQDKFQNIISEKPGQKYFIIDPYLQQNIMNMIIFNDQIKNKILSKQQNQHIEDQNEIHSLFDFVTVAKNITLIFFIYPEVKSIKKVINICEETRKIRKIEQVFDIYFWPQRNFLATEMIQLLNADTHLNVRDFVLDLIPLDVDLLSLEINTSFKDLYLDGDLQVCQFSANAIQKLQDIYGKIKNVFAIGKLSRYIMEIIEIDDQNKNECKKKNEVNEIESLIIFDRSIDFFTPFCSQLLYQGQLEDIFEINGNLLSLDSNIFKEGDNKEKNTKVVKRCTGETKHAMDKNYGDDIFQLIKDKRIAEAKKEIQTSAEIIKEFKQKSKNLDKKNAELSEATELVKKSRQFLNQIPQIFDHIQICDKIEELMRTIAWYKSLEIEQNIMINSKQKETIDYVEVLMALSEPLEKVLQLLCMQSLMDNGIDKKALQIIEKDIFLTYGFSNLSLIDNLKAMELIKYKEQLDKKDSWNTVIKKINLVSDVVNSEEISFPYSGYIPILPKLVEEIMRKGNLDEISLQLQQLISDTDIIQPQEFIPSTKRKINPVVVFVIGGITYGEVAALRILGRTCNKEVLILTTNMISYKKIIGNLTHRKIDPLFL